MVFLIIIKLYFVDKNVSEEYYQKILLIIDNYKNNLLIKKLNNGYNKVKENFSEKDIVDIRYLYIQIY